MHKSIPQGVLKKWKVKFDKPQKVMLKCRNSHTVSETINKDKEQKRSDCFNFFRYIRHL